MSTNTKAPELSFLDSAYADVAGWLSSWFTTPTPAPVAVPVSDTDAAHRAALERAAQVAAAYDEEYRAWMHDLVEKSISRTLRPLEESLLQVQQATDRLREGLGKSEPNAKKTAAKKKKKVAAKKVGAKARKKAKAKAKATA